MSTPIRSPGGVFVQSPGGVRDTGEAEPPLVFGSSTLFTASARFACQPTEFLLPDCAGGPDNVFSPSWRQQGFTQGQASVRTIVAITQSNPCRVQIALPHGYETGMSVLLASWQGMPELSPGPHLITIVNANEFSLDGVDSTLYSLYTESGTAAVQGIPWTFNYKLTGRDSGVVDVFYTNCIAANTTTPILDSVGAQVPERFLRFFGAQIGIVDTGLPDSCVGLPLYTPGEEVLMQEIITS